MSNKVEPTIKFNKHADGQNEILIYGVIGDSYWDDVNSQAFFDQLKALDGADVTVRINSYGGSVVAGTAIHTMLAMHSGKVIAQIDGYAMSMASVIAMAADEIQISEIGGFMIHSPWSFAAGNADELRKEADVLDGMEASLVNAYHSKTGIDKTELAQMLKDETWIYADEAVERGFADSTIKPIEAQACFDQSIESKLKAMPEAMAAFIAMHEEDEDPTDTSTEEGTDEEQVTDSQGDDQVTDEASADTETEDEPPQPSARELEKARCKGIHAACKAAGLPHLAESYIDKDFDVDTVKSLLIEIKAGIDENQVPAATVKSKNPNPSSESADIWSAGHEIAGINQK